MGYRIYVNYSAASGILLAKDAKITAAVGVKEEGASCGMGVRELDYILPTLEEAYAATRRCRKLHGVRAWTEERENARSKLACILDKLQAEAIMTEDCSKHITLTNKFRQRLEVWCEYDEFMGWTPGNYSFACLHKKGCGFHIDRYYVHEFYYARKRVVVDKNGNSNIKGA